MNVQIQTVRFNADSKLMEHVNKKIEKLKTFHDRITDVDVYLKLDSTQKIKDKIVHIKVTVPRHSLFAKANSKKFEESFDNAFESLVAQLKKQKEKMIA